MVFGRSMLAARPRLLLLPPRTRAAPQVLLLTFTHPLFYVSFYLYLAGYWPGASFIVSGPRPAPMLYTNWQSAIHLWNCSNLKTCLHFVVPSSRWLVHQLIWNHCMLSEYPEYLMPVHSLYRLPWFIYRLFDGLLIGYVAIMSTHTHVDAPMGLYVPFGNGRLVFQSFHRNRFISEPISIAGHAIIFPFQSRLIKLFTSLS